MMKIAVLGGFFHAHAVEFAEKFRALGAEVTCLWDSDSARGAQVAALAATRFESRLEKALEGCTAAVVCAAPERAGEICLAALKAEKDVLCDKYLSVCPAQVEEIAAAAQGRRLLAAMPLMHRATNRTVISAAVEGAIGLPRTLRIANCHTGALKPDFPAWYEGMELHDLGAHSIYMTCKIMGAPERAEVKRDDEGASLKLFFENGAKATIVSSYRSAEPYFFAVGGADIIAADDEMLQGCPFDFEGRAVALMQQPDPEGDEVTFFNAVKDGAELSPDWELARAVAKTYALIKNAE